MRFDRKELQRWGSSLESTTQRAQVRQPQTGDAKSNKRQDAARFCDLICSIWWNTTRWCTDDDGNYLSHEWLLHMMCWHSTETQFHRKYVCSYVSLAQYRFCFCRCIPSIYRGQEKENDLILFKNNFHASGGMKAKQGFQTTSQCTRDVWRQEGVWGGQQSYSSTSSGPLRKGLRSGTNHSSFTINMLDYVLLKTI